MKRESIEREMIIIMKIAVIGDLHIGALSAKTLRAELDNYCLNVLTEEQPDLIIVAGDLIDKKLSFNSDDSKLVVEIIESFTQLAPVRLIRGTRTHDLNQLNNFLYLENKEGVDLKVINLMEKERFNGLNLLYMPEEYMEDYFDHYQELLSKKYDIGFFHGTWNFAGFANKIQETERHIKQAPVYKYDEMKKVAKVFVGGHIHSFINHKDTIYYTGSFSRWHMGEEDPKGFIMMDVDEKTKKSTIRFITNKAARKYITIDANTIINDDKLTIAEKINKIEQHKKDKSIYKLRIQFDVLEENTEITMLKDYFSNDENVKLHLTDIVREEKDEEEAKLTEEYAFIFNKEYDMAHMISMYLEKHDDITIPVERVQTLLEEE